MTNEKKYPIRVGFSGDKQAIQLEKYLSSTIIGQPKAVQRLVEVMITLNSGLRDYRRPIGALIFAGPSGCGKTYAAKAFAQIYFSPIVSDFPNPLTIIQCSNLVERHQIATLIGSPPGYIGSDRISLLHTFNIGKYSLLAFYQSRIESCEDEKEKKDLKQQFELLKICFQALQEGQGWLQQQKERINVMAVLGKAFAPLNPFSIILFDEIEKAHPDVWNLLLGILEDGQLQLANSNTITDFTNSFIILTTNTGSREIQKAIGINRLGLPLPQQNDPAVMEKAIYSEARKALEKIFPPELMGRFGSKIVSFRLLDENDLTKIFHRQFGEIGRQLEFRGIFIACTRKFRKFVVRGAISQKYGVRVLRDAVEEYVLMPLSRAISSDDLKKGDSALFATDHGKPVLMRQLRKRKGDS